MTSSRAPTPIRAADYEVIEAALMDTARGRWFLAEYGRRNRTADTQILLEAITKLETAMIRPKSSAGTDLIRRDLIEMSEAITRTRQEIAAIKPPEQADSQLIAATEELDAIVASTEKATSDILEAAEDIQEIAWLLREAGTDDGPCDRLDERTIDIYTACSFQDITGQRTQKVVQALGFLESRVNSMIEIWGVNEIAPQRPSLRDDRPDAHLLNGPQLEGQGLDQDAIDGMIAVPDVDIEVVEADPEPEAAQAEPPVEAPSPAEPQPAAEVEPPIETLPAVVADPEPETAQAEPHAEAQQPVETHANVAAQPTGAAQPPVQTQSIVDAEATAEVQPPAEAAVAPAETAGSPLVVTPVAQVAAANPPRVSPAAESAPPADVASATAKAHDAAPDPLVEAQSAEPAAPQPQRTPAPPAPLPDAEAARSAPALDQDVIQAANYTDPPGLKLEDLDQVQRNALFS